jgi:hypothetical protein
VRYRDEEITAIDVVILLDAVLEKPDLRGWALILLAGIEECSCGA